MKLWRKARFRDDVVHARCNDAGAFVVEKGLVPFCYKPGGKVYKTHGAKLEAVEGAVPEGFDGPPAGAASGGRGKAGRTGKVGPKASGRWRSEDVAVQLWTDGACSGNPGPAGIGVLYRYKGEERELSEYLGHGTNNIAELTAILRGTEMVEDPSLPVDVMTDSSYCVGLLTKGWKAKANQELVRELRAAVARFSDLRLVKVAGHAGVEGNEAADQLAVAAIAARP